MDARLQDRINRYEMAVAFARQMIEELGEEQAYGILARAFEKMQLKNAAQLRERLGGNSLELLAEDNRRTAQALDNFDVLEATDRHVALKITRCVAYEAFKALGLPEICRLYCESDHAYIKAFNPDMKLIRTKTIAAGDAYCDHIWALEDDK